MMANTILDSFIEKACFGMFNCTSLKDCDKYMECYQKWKDEK